MSVGRRAFLKLSGAAAIGPCLQPLASGAAPLARQSPPIHALRIRAANVELAPGHFITTTAYDGRLPGPLLRGTVGQPMVMDIYNETDATEQVNWHGHDVPCPDVPAHSVRRVEIVPARPGLYFYHSNRIAAARLDAGLYSGQIGALLVEAADPIKGCHFARRCDREAVLVLKGCEPFIHRTARGCEIGYGSVTINGRMVGRGAQVPFNPGERVLLHVLNASATEPHILRLPGHSFEIVALDGNPVPSPARACALYLSPGERVCARVEITEPAAWAVHPSSAGVWDYTRFGCGQLRQPDGSARAPVDLVLTRHDAARSGFNRWSINGATFSTSNPRPLLHLRHGMRHRLRICNTSDEIIPLHLQRHLLQIASIDGIPTAGVVKDIVTVGPQQRMEVDFVADNPGRALLYCTRQLHRDFGLMALVDYT